MYNLILLNADFSLLIGIPYGIIIATIVIIAEIYLLKKYLKAENGKTIIIAVTLSNLTSFLLGRFLFDHPLSYSMDLITLLILCAIISIIIEAFVNYLFLHEYGSLKVFIGTTLVNVVSNLFAGICIYQYLHEFLYIPRWASGS